MKPEDIFNQIKEQAHKQEQKDFASKEKVWSQIEHQLDEKEQKVFPWKIWSIAASLLLIVGMGIWYYNSNPSFNENVVVNNEFPSHETKESTPSIHDKKSDNAQEATKNIAGNVLDKLEDANSQDSSKTKILDELEKNTLAVHSKDQQKSLVLPSSTNKISTPSSPEVFELPKTDTAINNAQLLEEVVVVGFGKALKSKVTGMKNYSSNPIGESYRNENVILDETAMPLKEEIQGGKIYIRGISSVQQQNEPLIVIDGLVSNSKVMNEISPEKIDAFHVLKDEAATALYGSRGANGVLFIQTKNLSDEKKKQLQLKLHGVGVNKNKNIADAIVSKHIKPKIEVSQESYEYFKENPFESPATAPLSTFSIDVDNASYSNIRRFLNNGQSVPKKAVRIEEMINYFNYNYEQPKGKEPLAIHTELSVAPWNPQHQLLKIGLQAKKLIYEHLPASNLVFLIDVSGSMSDDNKLPLLKASMRLLVEELRDKDKVSIVVYAGDAGLVLPSTTGDQKQKILTAIDQLNAGGSTAGGAGIELAYRTAQENFIKNGNNRIILATDGDFNVGASSNQAMEELIEEKRKTGIFLTVLGYGMGNYKDDKMEILANKGNGNYAYIDNMQEAHKFLVKEFGGTMFTVAKDVKVQIEFNPTYVQAYRLIGYENRRLRPEDFKNDAIDAGEMGSGHSVTALYEIIPKGVSSDYFVSENDLKYQSTKVVNKSFGKELGTVKFRYKEPNGNKSKELVEVIPHNVKQKAKTSVDFKFASAVAWFGLKLRDSKLIPNKNTDEIKRLAKEGRGEDGEGYRAEFMRLVEMVK